MTTCVKRAPKIFTLLPAEYDIMRNADEFIANDMIVLLPNQATHFVWPRGSTENSFHCGPVSMVKTHTLTFERDDVCDAQYLQALATKFTRDDFTVKVSSACRHPPAFLCATKPDVKGISPVWTNIVVCLGGYQRHITVECNVGSSDCYLDAIPARFDDGDRKLCFANLDGNAILQKMWNWFERIRTVKSWLVFVAEKDLGDVDLTMLHPYIGGELGPPPLRWSHSACFPTLPSYLENRRDLMFALYAMYFRRGESISKREAENELEIIVAPFGYRPLDILDEDQLRPTDTVDFRLERTKRQKFIMYKKIILSPHLLASWCIDASDIALALYPIRLPAYVVLWILQWLHPTLFVIEKDVIDAIQRTHSACVRLYAERSSKTKGRTRTVE
jgi:hypothetical protein